MYKRPMLALFAAFFAVAAPASAAPQPPPPAIAKLVDAVNHSAATDNGAGLSGLYTDDAVVVDENAPFTWRGPDAGAQWWKVVEAVTAKVKLTHMKLIGIRVSEFAQTNTDAYLIESMTISGVAAGKPFAESGTMTYTFHNDAGKWLISTQIWTTKP